MMRVFGLAALALAGAAQGAEVVTSPAPADVAVTIYRAPERGADEAMRLDWLGGYALVTETREVSIPAGEAVIRFEGVAAGMLPESAIVSGLPQGVREKNLDADLLAPRSLYARNFGRPVTLRRTDGKGHTREEVAILRSGPDGAAIFQTKAGFEVANCGGLTDAIVYAGVPEGLVAKPTLSVATSSPVASRVKVKLSYLAWGFDWQANYVLAMKPGGREAEMTAWVTLASSDVTSFPKAQAAVVGGKLNFETERDEREEAEPLEMRCRLSADVPPPPPPLVMAPAPMADSAEIVVTSMAMKGYSQNLMRAAVTVKEESLGDLKLYRVPHATTVAARGQKQVGLMDARKVKLAVIYAADVYGDGEQDARIKLRMQNRKADGLGLALPAGKVAVVQPLGVQGGGVVVAPFGEGRIEDKAEGEEVNVTLEDSAQVHVSRLEKKLGERMSELRVKVGNANAWPVRFEGKLFLADGAKLERASAALGRKDGRPLWAVTIPAQGSATLTYRVRAAK